MLKNLLDPKPKPGKTSKPAPLDAIEEHHIVLPGLDVAFNEKTHTVFLVDTTGGGDDQSLKDLEDHLRSQGWFLHGVKVEPTPPPPAPGEKSA